MRFNEWKTLTAYKLVKLSEKYKDDKKKQQTIDVLITRLHYLRSRDLGSFLILLYHGVQDIPELKEILPDEESLKEMMLNQDEE